MAVASNMPALGNTATAFDLLIANPSVDGHAEETRSLAQYEAADVVVVVFTCNHCPYAIHVEDELIAIAKAYAERGVQFIAISSNDPAQYPTDSFEHMAERAKEKQYPFPYLWDKTQDIAHAYGAACTPDFFVYDKQRTLVYRGRMDETRPGMGDAHGTELKNALDQILETGAGPEKQFPSMGCSIKWYPGNAPA